MAPSLESFTPAVRDWFLRAFAEPTAAQQQAWPAISRGENVLLSAPTGSGKTLAAFLWGLDRLVAEPAAERRTRLVYVSPLKALSYDLERNLRAPLRRIGIQVPVDDLREPDAGAELDPLAGGENSTSRSIWPAIYPELLDLIEAHRSTIVFVNNRRGAERLALRLNELAAERKAERDGVISADGAPPDVAPLEIARAHHGSLAREERLVVEELLKSGDLPCLVATSSLELGIDMGAVDLVLQVESPKSVTAGLQRIGRAGHGVAEVSKGRTFPKFRADLLEATVVVKRMREGEIETTVVPRNPMDVLAQQIVAMSASGEEWSVPDLHELVRRAHPFSH